MRTISVDRTVCVITTVELATYKHVELAVSSGPPLLGSNVLELLKKPVPVGRMFVSFPEKVGRSDGADVMLLTRSAILSSTPLMTGKLTRNWWV